MDERLEVDPRALIGAFGHINGRGALVQHNMLNRCRRNAKR
jgi:hypothetical protein